MQQQMAQSGRNFGSMQAPQGDDSGSDDDEGGGGGGGGRPQQPHQSQRRGSIAPDTYVAASDQEELVQVVVRVMNEVFDESQRNKFWVSVRKALTDKFVDGIHQVQCLRSCWSAACVCW